MLGTYIVGSAVCLPLCATLPSSGFQQCLAEHFNTFATDAFERHHQAYVQHYVLVTHVR